MAIPDHWVIVCRNHHPASSTINFIVVTGGYGQDSRILVAPNGFLCACERTGVVLAMNHDFRTLPLEEREYCGAWSLGNEHRASHIEDLRCAGDCESCVAARRNDKMHRWSVCGETTVGK